MKKSNAFDYDNLNYKIIDKVFDLILPHMTNLCNNSFETGEFPSKMKISKVSPIFKKGNSKQCSNYRPIAILPVLSKLVEKLFSVRLTSFLVNNNTISPSQYGFQKNKSTTMACINYYELIAEALLKKQTVISISLDLSKAFDSISHKILLQKLNYYGIRGTPLKWLESYLSQRQQCVALNNGKSLSNLEYLTNGVPQGSILGPQLFLLYINDIVKTSNKLSFILYADDSTILFTYDYQTPNPELILNKELQHISDWITSNRLQLNVNKTQCILYSNQTNPQPTPDILLNNCILTFSKTTNILGLIFDDKLKFDSHIKSIRTKIARGIGLINRSKHLFTKPCKKLLYNSLILPHLTYGIELWGASASSLLYTLEKLQKKCLRIIENKKRNSHITYAFKMNKTLKIKDLYKLNITSLMHKALNETLPPNLQTLFTKNQTNIRTRQSQFNLSVKHKGSKIQNIRPSVSGPYLWNTLPNALKEIKLNKHFRRKHKQNIINDYSLQ